MSGGGRRRAVRSERRPDGDGAVAADDGVAVRETRRARRLPVAHAADVGIRLGAAALAQGVAGGGGEAGIATDAAVGGGARGPVLAAGDR
ncbi:hypothetical protein [Luteimonas huabeiensis]|uniref:hypothetical protein n=1 Tax=Luteimonas huabeiensis TaxID=1244513 RepID=UPI001267DBB8|nr:hypothetical protein [Luteimonas huabeiensis]